MTLPSHPSSTWTTYMRTEPGPADPEAFYAHSRHPDYPLASAYDPEWVQRNQMGPNALWLIEDLTRHLELAPGMRVLDLGCGTAMTSIFLAHEFGVEVWAADLWIEPTPNLARITEAEVDHLVRPIRAEAHALPFALGYFDTVVSVDAYQYFGTDVRYLSYLQQFVKPHGVVAVSVPGNSVDPEEIAASVGDPPAFRTFGADWYAWRSPQWWARLWSQTRGVVVEHVEMVPDGNELWRRHAMVGAAWSGIPYDDHPEAQLLTSPEGSTLGFARLIARHTGEPPRLDFGPGPFATRLV